MDSQALYQLCFQGKQFNPAVQKIKNYTRTLLAETRANLNEKQTKEEEKRLLCKLLDELQEEGRLPKFEKMPQLTTPRKSFARPAYMAETNSSARKKSPQLTPYLALTARKCVVSPESIKEAKPARSSGGMYKKSAIPVSSPKRQQKGGSVKKSSSKKTLRFTTDSPSLIPRGLESAEEGIDELNETLTEENADSLDGEDFEKNDNDIFEELLGELQKECGLLRLENSSTRKKSLQPTPYLGLAKPARRAGGSAIPVSSPKRPSGSGLKGHRQEGAVSKKSSSKRTLIPRSAEEEIDQLNDTLTEDVADVAGKDGGEENGMSIQVKKSVKTEETNDGKRVIHVPVPYAKGIEDMTIELNFKNGLQKNTFVILHMKSP